MGQMFDYNRSSVILQTLHSFPNINVDGAIVDKWGKVVLGDDGVGNVLHRNVDALVLTHWSLEAKIFYVNCHELGILGGNHAVEKTFGSGETSGFGWWC